MKYLDKYLNKTILQAGLIFLLIIAALLAYRFIILEGEYRREDKIRQEKLIEKQQEEAKAEAEKSQVAAEEAEQEKINRAIINACRLESDKFIREYPADLALSSNNWDSTKAVEFVKKLGEEKYQRCLEELGYKQ